MMEHIAVIKRNFNIIFLILFVVSCKNNDSNRVQVDYNVYSASDSIVGYEKRIITRISKNERIDTLLIYSKNNNLEETFVQKYLLNNDGDILINNNETISVKKIDSCYDSNHFYTNLDITTCYLGSVDDDEYGNVHEFIVTENITDGLKKKVFLDDDFILVKEEYLKGYRDYYRIERGSVVKKGHGLGSVVK